MLVHKLKAVWSLEDQSLFWPKGKKEIDGFIFAVYGPGPFKRRTRIKWLRRHRKLY
jgi:hypothetical protein